MADVGKLDRYQTGALAPFVRWLSQGMHRAAVPPPRPQPPPAAAAAARADNDDPAAAVPLNEAVVPGISTFP